MKSSQDYCSVQGCNAAAVYAAYLHDDVPAWGRFFEPDNRCPFLCQLHAEENEAGAHEIHPRWMMYPYTKPHTAGTTRYKKLSTGAFLKRRRGSHEHPSLLRSRERRITADARTKR